MVYFLSSLGDVDFFHFQPNSELPFMERGGESRNKCVELPFFGDIELLTLCFSHYCLLELADCPVCVRT